MPAQLNREAFGLGVSVVGEVAEEGAACALVVLLGGKEGAEGAVHLGGGFADEGGGYSG